MADSRSSRGGSRSSSGSRSGSGRSGGGRAKSASSRSKSSTSRAKSSTSRAKSSTSRAKSSTSRAKSSTSRSKSSGSTQSKRRAAARKGGQARARQQKAQKAGRRAGVDFSGKSAAELRDALTKNVVNPLNIVMISRERIEEVFDEAVKRGRMTRGDAQDLVQGLVQRGRKQTNDVLRDLEQLLGRGGEAIEGARKRGASAAKKGSSRVRTAVDPALATADRARRVAKVGPKFPILGYDDLTAAQVQSRLDGLTAAELRKVRDYERRNANRKSVLDAIEGKLS